ncbi:hypothetical protein GCM10023333_42960 [Ferrimonas pelagia]|uniref:Uncharacterized protein n=1 Tax=Ferrimonas pelagia TaxID=1177826 RepID=A0ABP9FK65_9GAMM
MGRQAWEQGRVTDAAEIWISAAGQGESDAVLLTALAAIACDQEGRPCAQGYWLEVKTEISALGVTWPSFRHHLHQTYVSQQRWLNNTGSGLSRSERLAWDHMQWMVTELELLQFDGLHEGTIEGSEAVKADDRHTYPRFYPVLGGS